MRRYLGIWLGLFAAAAGLTFLIGPNLLAIAVYPIPLALFAARKRGWPIVGLLAGHAAAAIVGLMVRLPIVRMTIGEEQADATLLQALGVSISTAIAYVALASSGVSMGLAISRRASYGAAVAAMSAHSLLVMLAYVALAWNAWNAQIGSIIEYFREYIRIEPDRFPPTTALRMFESLDWLDANRVTMGLGFNFLLILTFSCLCVSGARVWLVRWYGDTGITGSFREMRPPDRLIFGLIAVAILCAADWYWPGTTLRIVAWNCAIAMGTVYFFNGLGIALYAIHAFRITALIFVAMIVVLLVLVKTGPLIVLSTLGVADTWVNIRKRIDGWAPARQDTG